MLEYNANFLAELNKGKSDPAVRVHLQEDIFFAEKTSEFDWGNNAAESNVDYATFSGSVILKNGFWSQLISGSTIRYGHSAIVDNGKMYIFGGFNSGAYKNDLYEYNISTKNWTLLTPIGGPPTARAFHSAIIDNGKMYIFGGLSSGATPLNDVWEYNISTNTWTAKTSGATIRYNHTAIVDSGKMYVFGGDNGSILLNDVYEYNISGDSWTSKTSGATARRTHTAIVDSGKMYVFGGDDGSILLNDVYEYNISGDSWTSKTSGATARRSHTAILDNGKMYVFGGSDISGDVNDVWEYNIAANVWTQRTSGATARELHSAIVDDGVMYIFGGVTDTPTNLNDLWQYDIRLAEDGNILTDAIDLGSTPTVDGEWEFADSVPAGTTLTYEAWSSATGVFDIWNEYVIPGTKPSARREAASVQVGTILYIFGGGDLFGVEKNDLWKIDLAALDAGWTQLASGATARTGATLVEYSGKLYLFGGLKDFTYYNDIWEYNISGDSWSSKTSGATIRYGHTAIVNSSKMYIYGGWNGGRLNDIWEYNISGDSWTSKTSGPAGRYGHSAIADSGKMYVFGGNKSTGYTNEIHEYNISGDSWTPKTSGATARIEHSAVISGGKMYVHGGFAGPLQDTWEYNISGDSWTQLASASVKRSHFSMGVNADKLFVFGGNLIASVSNDMWSYGTLGGDAVSIGTVQDGDAITDLKRYYAVRATLGANTNRDETPVLSSIIADFATYLEIRSSIGMSALTTTIDLFEESTISQMTVTLALNTVISSWMATKKPRNKRVRIFIGFNAPGFADDDFEKFYFGTVANADITSADKVKIYIDGLAKNWKEDVPEAWEDAGDDVTWTNEHPIDVMLDIYNTYLPVRASALLLSSFSDVKAATPGWVVTRTITDNPIEGKKLLEELRKLLSCFFIPQPDGSVKIKRWDPAELAVNSFTDVKLMGKNYIGNYRKIINRIFIYFDWAGTGDDTGDFDTVLPDTRPLSKADYGKWETETIKDKWTPVGANSQVQDRITKLLDRYEDPPPRMPATVDLKEMATEEGDIVNITTKRAPSTDMLGIVGVRFQVVKKTIDWQGKKLNLELLAVTG